MKKLNYETLRESGYTGFLLEKAPNKVLQFGEGNFLRAFADAFIDQANEKAGFGGKVVLVQPIAQGGLKPFFKEQQGLYTLILRGFENGETIDNRRIISSIGKYINPYEEFSAFLKEAENPELRYIVSNTTEAGIAYDSSCKYDDAPQASFPGKLTRFLHERWKKHPQKGLVILSCELIDNNGKELESCVQKHISDWNLEQEFIQWLADKCLFCSTLVDRIVTGYPRGDADTLNRENGYTDNLLDVAEVFGLWVIEGPAWLEEELPFKRAGLPVRVVADHSPYKRQKVRILNGAHTSMVCAAYLSGQDIVRDSVQDALIGDFLKKTMYDEILPVLDLPKESTAAFAAAVMERFQNPFVDHALLSIALNSTSKWKARVLPSLKDYLEKFGKLPPRLVFSLAAYIAFYKCSRWENGKLYGQRFGEEYEIMDDADVLSLFGENKDVSLPDLGKAVLSSQKLWGEDLTAVPGLLDTVTDYLRDIETNGMKTAIGNI